MIGFGSLGAALTVLAQASPATRPSLDQSPPPIPKASIWSPEIDQFLAVGWLHTFRDSPTSYGNGVEVTYMAYPLAASRFVGLGGYTQLQSVGDEGRFAFSVGPQLSYFLFGLELGYEYLSSGQGQPQLHGLHLAPFVSLGSVSLAGQVVMPFASSGAGELPGFQYAAAFTFKIPAPLVLERNFAHGRPLREAGEIQLAQAKPTNDWQPADVPVLSPNGALGELWLRRALAEHASIATFAELTLELMAHGAPPELLHAAQRAQADELRHAIACFGITSALLERQVGPGEFRAAARGVRSRSKLELALESLRDGCLGEGYAAALARAALARAPAELRSNFEAIAREEAEHAELGFQVLRWCLHAGSPEVANAIESALRELPQWLPTPLPDGISSEEAAAHGVFGAVEEAVIFLAVRVQVENRVRVLLHEVARALS
jgi:hypothetical protein